MKIKTMKAAILVEQKKPLVLDTVSLPENLDFGQVLVKLEYSGICGSQINEINGTKGEDRYLPHLLGHEGVGEVVECGPHVTTVKPGGSVVLHWRKGQGIESKPPVYSWKNKPLNAGYVTTFNDHAVVSENRITTIPKDFPREEASLFGCAVTTAFGVINNNAALKIGQSVIVYGAGGIGLNIVQAAAMVSGNPIIAIDRVDEKLDLAKKMGATHCINSNSGSVENKIKEILGNEGADVVVDNTGNVDVIALCYTLTKSVGKTVLVGVPKAEENISIHSLPLYFGKSLSGSHGGESDPSIDIPNYVRLHGQGKLDMNSVITDRFQFEDINDAIQKMTEGNVKGRCMIRF